MLSHLDHQDCHEAPPRLSPRGRLPPLRLRGPGPFGHAHSQACLGPPAAARPHDPGEPGLPSLTDTHPEPRQAVRAAGPFDNRFEIDRLAFDGHNVTGSVRITSDVSDLLELVVVAGFYDAGGQLVGEARFEHHADGDSGHQHPGPPSETEEFSIAVPAQAAGKAVSTAVGVPVLVNE